MIDNLDEEIKHCEEIVNDMENREGHAFIAITYAEYASEYRQLAEWLKELKAFRKAEKEIEQELVNWDDIDNGKCRGLFLATSIIQHYKDEEVNADDE